MISVVIPAYNEGRVIERCLTALLDDHSDQLDVIVVCNGCSDNTAQLARRFGGVQVIEIEQASKIAALNTGDTKVKHYPVAYVDADIQLKGEALVKCAEIMKREGPLISAPSLRVDVSSASLLVKGFYAVWTKLPYFADKHMVGSGVFILSETGRKRFNTFPNIVSDDGFVRAQFARAERLTVDGVYFTITAPKTLANLIKIKTRARFGNLEIKQKFPKLAIGGENRGADFISLMLRKPWLIPAGILYALTQWQTKRLSKRRLSEADFTTWERDESSRF